MNNERRKLLQKQIDIIEQAKQDIEILKDEEQKYADDMPENLQSSDKHDKAEQAVSSLEEAINNIDEAIQQMNGTIQ